MSTDALSWVFKHSPTKASDRLVLLVLADMAGDEWESWPGIETLRHRAGLDRARTVSDALTRLTNAGHIERVVNGAVDTRMRPDRRPNLYRVLTGHGVTCSDPRCKWCGVTRSDERGVGIRPNGGSESDRTGGRETSPKPLKEPPVEPPQEPTPSLPLGPSFGEFWNVYPRHVARAAAEKAWTKAVKRADPADVVAGATRYAVETRGRATEHIAHPATWLNHERWRDEPGANGSTRRPTGPTTPPGAARRDGTEGRVQL